MKKKQIKKEVYLLPVQRDPRNDKQTIYIEVIKFQERNSFGRVDALIAPVSGHGETWVNKEVLSLKTY